MVRTREGCLTLLMTITAVAVTACGTLPPTPNRSGEPPRPLRTAAIATAAPSPSPAVVTAPPVRRAPPPSGAPAEESLPTSASTERDGIKLTIALRGINPMHAGNGSLAQVTIENTGDRVLSWINDGCDTNAGIVARMPASWPDTTLEVSPELEPYRELLREEARVDDPVSLRFLPGALTGYRSFGCADLGITRELGPRRKVTQEFLWDGFAAPRLGLPPSGPVTLRARFERWSRPGPGKDGTPIQVTLDSWVLDGRPVEYLSPAEAIDAALADERLASWLITQPLHSGSGPIAEYDPDLGLWAVGLLMYRDDHDPVLHAAFVDPITGEVIAVREHPVTF